MPIAMNPKETFEHVLENDKALPEARRPRFRFRYMTMAECAEAVAPVAVLEDQGRLASPEAFKAIASAASYSLVGWDNLTDREGAPIPFARENATRLLLAILTISEAWELYYAAQRGSRLSVPEKNASASPSPASSGPSAGAAHVQDGDAADALRA